MYEFWKKNQFLGNSNMHIPNYIAFYFVIFIYVLKTIGMATCFATVKNEINFNPQMHRVTQ